MNWRALITPAGGTSSSEKAAIEEGVAYSHGRIRTAKGAGEDEDGVEAGTGPDLYQAGRIRARLRLFLRLTHLQGASHTVQPPCAALSCPTAGAPMQMQLQRSGRPPCGVPEAWRDGSAGKPHNVRPTQLARAWLQTHTVTAWRSARMRLRLLDEAFGGMRAW